MTASRLHGFRSVPRTGVIYVMHEAARHGFLLERERWSNLGQGAPETGDLPGAPARLGSIELLLDDHEYAPVVGLSELRDAVAALYNHRYRRSKKSQYTRDNVAICAGGRLALTRLVSAISRSNFGHFLPDYTAYEELLDAFGRFVPIPLLTDAATGYAFSPEELEREVLGRGLSTVLLSNPCNPTGRLIEGDDLGAWVEIGRRHDCTLVFDEFYSHYVYGTDRTTVSAAEHVDDVDADPVVIIDGLTKNWRYPGLRVSWTIAPPEIVERVASAGSFLDGGCARPTQMAAIPMIDPEVADQEAAAIREAFTAKRSLMLERLRDLGVRVDCEPRGGFYCWGDVSELPEPFATGRKLFERALEAKVIVVPGVFFDINPGKRRPDRSSRFGNHVRFSFGPPREELERGLDALAELIR
ncbi:MAG: pyridoxal phosphate-dependent aminotransferase [Planctomycetes bacterium]|nr:pyridoxal phosphate-dependent aminotransferase [Planctomycetota bacterium]